MPTSNIQRAVSSKEGQVATIVKKMAMVYKNLRTYHLNNPVLQELFESLHKGLTAFLNDHGLLTLQIKTSEILYGSIVVYSCEEKSESLAFNLYKDGIRLLSFRDGLPKSELMRFMIALNEARDADPYQADLVTILWEKDLSYITYRAVDIFLEDEETEEIPESVEKDVPPGPGGEPPNSDLILRDLGLPEKTRHRHLRLHRRITDADIRRIVREIVDEDYGSMLRRCGEICTQILLLDPEEETFHRIVGFLARTCETLVYERDFLAASNIVSDMRSIKNQLPQSDDRRKSIDEAIGRLGESKNMKMIGEYLNTISEQRAEEVYVYLTLMGPTAIAPLCEILAECEVRRTRYLLCRAISVISKDELERLQPFLNDHRWYFIRNIVMILGMAGNPEAVPLLYQVVAHPEARVRREVARSVGRIGSPAGMRILEDLIHDPNKMVRMAALTSMRQVGSPEARRILEPIITSKDFMKLGPDERREVMRTYGSLGSESLDFLLDIIEGSHKHLDDKTRAMAVYGIAVIESEETREVLNAIANNCKGPIRNAALEALATLMP